MMPTNWNNWLADRAGDRQRHDLVRSLSPLSEQDQAMDLAGNDYLGLSGHPAVIQAAAQAAHTWGTGARASRLVTGTTQLHADLETALAALLAQPAALVFSSGYAANTGLLTTLADAETLIVSDAHIHASLIDGARLSRAQVRVVPHSDVDAVDLALREWTGDRALVLAESIYSVLGDAAPLTGLAQVCANHGALLVVDEAHGVGLRGDGAGLVRELGLAGHPNVIVTATLSKSLGAQGGAVLGPEVLINDLINTSRPFIYDTGLAPPAAAAALAAIGLLDPELIDRLHHRRDQLADRLGVERPAGAVVSVPMPSPQVALAAQAQCLAAGVKVGCFRPPSVPDGISRLRITTNAGISDEDWARAVAVIEESVAGHQ
ncbi:MAG TPA: 8-amino-7-oxononanoate synthase [Marmoricola sp.]|nr:8-amino-7-oxononanoate synthase [Marmoricola sp.]